MRRRFALLPLLLLAAAPARGDDPKPKDDPPPAKARPQVELVFVVDTTGSMGGLLDGMRKKVFSIWGQVLAGKPAPDVRVGLVAYKDRKDVYVTRVVDLSPYTDEVYDALRQLTAAGGGDVPESVNQALDDAVHKISWGKQDRTLRMIFLLGDAPPHMDYPDDVKYPVTCKAAAKKGVVVTAVQCGSNPQCAATFADIAKLGKGAFLSVPQDGGADDEPATPHDDRLAELHAAVLETMIPFGDAKARDDMRRKWDELKKLTGAAAADHAVLEARLGKAAGRDLVEAVRHRGKIALTELPPDELPDELKKLAAAERDKHLGDVTAKRDALLAEAKKLADKRQAAVLAKVRELKGKGAAKPGAVRVGFDKGIIDTLRKHGTKVGISY